MPKPPWRYLTPEALVVACLIVELLLVAIDYSSALMLLLAVALFICLILVSLSWLTLAFIFRWPFQFGIRTILLLTVMVAILSAWLPWKVREATRQRRVVMAIWNLGGSVEYDNPFSWEPSWLSNLGGNDFLYEVRFVQLNCKPITDADLAAILSELPRIKGLLLPTTDITDAGLVHVGALTELEELSLNNTRITDAGLEHLTGLSRLRCLQLENTQITDDALISLEKLPILRRLDIDGITMKGFQELKKALPNCRINYRDDQGKVHPW